MRIANRQVKARGNSFTTDFTDYTDKEKLTMNTSVAIRANP